VADAAHDRGFRSIRLDRPGTSRARNAGWAAATAPLIAFIDDDCLVTEGWSERIEAAFADPSVGFVTGRVEADREASLSTSVFLEAESRRFERADDPGSFGGGSNMAFRRTAIASVGGFDEGMGPAAPLRAAEDQDLFWRLTRAGWAGVYDPAIRVTHRQWRTPAQAIRRQLAYGVGAAAVAVKAIRMGDPQGWRYLRARLWRDGIAQAGRALRKGYKSGAVGDAVRVVGVLGGAAAAWARPLVDGRYRP
jgi:cellulose synthase/poly-beta-1,6-N-acetylglucosamine synthase-like glycosyltransferase